MLPRALARGPIVHNEAAGTSVAPSPPAAGDGRLYKGENE